MFFISTKYISVKQVHSDAPVDILKVLCY